MLSCQIGDGYTTELYPWFKALQTAPQVKTTVYVAVGFALMYTVALHQTVQHLIISIQLHTRLLSADCMVAAVIKQSPMLVADSVSEIPYTIQNKQTITHTGMHAIMRYLYMMPLSTVTPMPL